MAQAAPKSKSPLGMPFPFCRALSDAEYGDLAKSVRECQQVDKSGVVYFKQLPMYTAALPYHWQQYPDAMNGFMKQELVEQGIKRAMEKASLINWSSGLSKLYPLIATGDGNCLLHAVALYMWGIEDGDLVLRKSLWETLNKGSFAVEHMKRWQHERSTADQASMPEFRYNTGEWGQEFDMVKSMASPGTSQDPNELPFRALEEFHIYTLANILRRPIMVIASSKVRSARGASLQPQAVSGLYLPLHWDPSLCCKFPIVLGFENSHFFPLMHTAPESAKDEGDLLVPLVTNTPGNMRFMKVHFSLPGENEEGMAREYLNVDSIIHCQTNKETAIGLPGAKLGYKSLGIGFSVWDAYFGLAERNLRVYYEAEYNPGGAEEPGDQEVRDDFRRSSEKNVAGQQYLPPAAAGGLPAASKPSNRGHGQCKTAGCPYQRSVSTGELCVECFNKGARAKCSSYDCLNKADVGLDGFCKVCHEGNKFQEANPSVQNGFHSGRSSGDSSPPDERFKNSELNSLAVDSIRSGLSKCIMPECELTGNPKTGDMCRDCYAKNMEVQNELADAMNPVNLEKETEDFVVLGKSGEEIQATRREPINSPKREGMKDRRTELLNQLGLPEDSSTRRSSASDRPRTSDRSHSAVITGQAGHHTGRSNPMAERSQSGPPVKITVKKDLCATAGCRGVRLRDRELCKSCTDRKNHLSLDEGGHDEEIHPRQRMEQSGGPQLYGNPRPASQQYREPGREDSAYGTRQMSSGRLDMARGHENYRPAQAQQVFQNPYEKPGPSPQPQQEPWRNHAGHDVDQRPSGRQEGGHGYSGYGQTQRERYDEQPRYDQNQRRCKIRRCRAPAAPPDFKYCKDCLADIEEEYIATRTAQKFQAQGQHDTTRSPRGQNAGHDPDFQQRNASMMAQDRSRGEGNIDMRGQLDQQLRDQFRHDRSDIQQNVPRDHVIPAQLKRGPCQRPGGCPDEMYGDPATGGMCSKCWKDVGSKQQGPGARSRQAPYRPEGTRDQYGGGYHQDVTRSAPSPLVTQGHYQEPRGRDGGYMNYGERVTQAEHVYEELTEKRCAQPECRRPAAQNVEGFCQQCHENYQALFKDFRQINTA